MNLVNLKKMFNYILLNVPKENIEMGTYRPNCDLKFHECKSTGCVIGHCTILDDYEDIPKLINDDIDFNLWSEKFTNIDCFSKNWEWCFGALWPNDKDQILLRLKYLIDNGMPPYDWEDLNDSNYKYLLPEIKLEHYELE